MRILRNLPGQISLGQVAWYRVRCEARRAGSWAARSDDDSFHMRRRPSHLQVLPNQFHWNCPKKLPTLAGADRGGQSLRQDESHAGCRDRTALVSPCFLAGFRPGALAAGFSNGGPTFHGGYADAGASHHTSVGPTTLIPGKTVTKKKLADAPGEPVRRCSPLQAR